VYFVLVNKNSLTLLTCLVSRDAKLTTALASVLGPEFVIVQRPIGGQVCQELHGDQFGALLFDIDSFSQPGETSELFDDLTRSSLPIIILASDENRTEAMRLVQRGAHSHVRKPPVVPELRTALRSALESRRLTRELQMAGRQMETATGLDQLVGTSAPLRLVYQLIRKVANLDASVLITGESGTGKELICQAIHNTGKRSKRPFVAVSCSAIPETLIEAELFGHERGAFTGTTGTREGYFEQAGDGTLFLDEIGELKLHTQVKLLRVLQQREFHRLGSSRVIPLRSRIVFATNRNLEQMVMNGEFRQDLYYRMNVISIPAPALRHIASDIPALARHFLLKYSELYGKIADNITPEALDCLQNYSWPGNIRQLENVIQRALMLAEGHSIETTDLPDIIQDLQFSAGEDNLLPEGSFERALRDYKVKLAQDAIQQCNGSKTLAAQRLSISRAYLHRLIRLDPATPDDNVAEIRAGNVHKAAAG
jgi:DNA-binding NtrC family response regulator